MCRKCDVPCHKYAYSIIKCTIEKLIKILEFHILQVRERLVAFLIVVPTVAAFFFSFNFSSFEKLMLFKLELNPWLQNIHTICYEQLLCFTLCFFHSLNSLEIKVRVKEFDGAIQFCHLNIYFIPFFDRELCSKVLKKLCCSCCCCSWRGNKFEKCYKRNKKR